MVMNPLETRFVADVMLGRLSKWLRVMGYDAHYQPFYKEGIIDGLVRHGRLLLSRNRRMIDKFNPSMLIVSEHVKIQLREILNKGHISLDSSQWFTRCLVCNTRLKKISMEEARAHIPEYIYTQNPSGMHFCSSCGRYFWPGSHKTRMMNQISEWNLNDY